MDRVIQTFPRQDFERKIAPEFENVFEYKFQEKDRSNGIELVPPSRGRSFNRTANLIVCESGILSAVECRFDFAVVPFVRRLQLDLKRCTFMFQLIYLDKKQGM